MDTMECSTLMGEVQRFVCGFAHRGNVLCLNCTVGLAFLENGKKTRMAISFYVYTKYMIDVIGLAFFRLICSIGWKPMKT